MTTTTFTLAAETDLELLTEVHAPELRTVRPLLQDMIAVRDFGTHTVEIGGDRTMRDADIGIMFFPQASRAGIRDNGGTHWTDATSLDDAERRYREDEMMA